MRIENAADANSRRADQSSRTWHQRWLKLRRWSGFVFVVYALALVTGTHLPNPEGLIPIETNDKWLHFSAYFGLAFLIATWRSQSSTITLRVSLGIWMIAAIWGAIDEVTQAIPGINRHCDLFDWLADISGAATGLFIWHLLSRTVSARTI